MGNPMVDAILPIMRQQFSEAFKIGGIGKEFDKEGKRKVEMDPKVMLNIYIPVSVYTDEKLYYFINGENQVIYIGNVDKEGVEKTIEKDVTTLSLSYNFLIAMATEDNDTLETILSDPQNLIALQQQFMLGMEYIKENGHIA